MVIESVELMLIMFQAPEQSIFELTIAVWDNQAIWRMWI